MKIFRKNPVLGEKFQPGLRMHGLYPHTLAQRKGCCIKCSMLLDIFARRYEDRPLRDSFGERDKRLLVQAFRILSEDMYPYYKDGKEDKGGVKFWTELHSNLSRELGLKELSPLWWTYTAKIYGNDVPQARQNTLVAVCEKWFSEALWNCPPDVYVKERLSLIELGFRVREEEIAAMMAPEITNAERLLAELSRPGATISGYPVQGPKLRRSIKVNAFKANVEELNGRFRQAGYHLHYHNGFIQMLTDDLIQKQVETPFWELVSDPDWANVDTEMKEALDIRDSGGRNPAFLAAKALESTIKIVSDKKGFTTGSEGGAHSYINNLGSKTNAFITQWESDLLKVFFTHVRNPMGHGAGSAEMPSLSRQQTEWAIEFSMSWIKNLIRRL